MCSWPELEKEEFQVTAQGHLSDNFGAAIGPMLEHFGPVVGGA